MPGRRDACVYIADMVEAAERILIFTSQLPDLELVDPDRPTRAAILHLLTVMGEAAKHVPDEVRSRHADLPWGELAGLRDKIVHYYFGLSDTVIIETVRKELPGDLRRLHRLLVELRAGSAPPPEHARMTEDCGLCSGA